MSFSVQIFTVLGTVISKYESGVTLEEAKQTSGNIQ